MVSFDEGRQRPANYIAICNNIADSYPFGVAHGLQKDAIQNAVDARKGKQKVRVHVELITNSMGKFLTITDSKTIGLTGPILYDAHSYEDDLPSDYHWARFESFAFTKDDPDAIGARGQGKFIFLRASREYTMYYDTLREDGIYRVGGTQATKTGCPILPPKESEAWEGEVGEVQLAKRCNLEPIKNIGSRIIIVDPVDEVCVQIEDGTFLDAIEETWFRAIEKQTLDVLVTFGGKTYHAKVPSPSPLPRNDSSDIKVWILGDDFKDKTITVYGEQFRIKNFHASYYKDQEIDESLHGIAIVHNGMKVTSIEMTTAPPNVRERITGFIEFDQNLERELRKGENQHPNHYNLKWRRKIPNNIRSYIYQQLDTFGQCKLGLGTDPRETKKRKRTNAEEWAMRQLLNHARDLDLFGVRGKVQPPIDLPPRPLKILGVSINNFTFPEPEIAPRIDWGQKFEDITITAYNRTETDLSVSILTQIMHGDTVIVQPIERQDVDLAAKMKYRTNAFDIDVMEYLYSEPGLYRISTSLLDSETGDRFDRVSRKFWVEKDPPLRQPFLLQPLPEFPEPFSHRQWYTSGSINNSPTLYYNLSHPAYRVIEEDGDSQAEYVLDIVLSGAMDFVLKRPNREDGSPDFHPLESDKILGAQQQVEREEVPTKTYDELARYISEIRWRVFEGEY